MDIQENPWSVKNIEEFLYFCCPECNEKDRSKELFLKHALEEHPNSKECVLNNLDIKNESLTLEYEEPDTEENNSQFYEDEIVKYEIKEEIDDQNFSDHQNFSDVKNFSDVPSSVQVTNDKSLKSYKCEICEKSYTQIHNLNIHIKVVHEGIVFKKSKVGHFHEKILIDLVEKSQLNNFSKFDPKKNEIWYEITEKFNELTGNQWDSKTIKKKWENFKYKLSEKKRVDKKLIMRKAKVHENIVVDLVEKSQLNNFSKCSPNRTAIWKEITEQFNKISGNEWDLDKVKKKWNNYISKVSQNKPKVEKTILEENSKDSNCDITEHKCDLCDKIFNKKHYLKAHISNVHGHKNYSCEHCGARFATKYSLKEHILIVHEGVKEYECQHCNKKFGHRGNLWFHVKSVHEKQRNDICDNCGKAFCNPQALKGHIRAVHEGIKDFKCEICPRAFQAPKDLSNHILTVHEKVRNHVCHYCSREFGRKDNLNTHIRAVHEKLKSYVCENCGQSFGTSSILKRHVKKACKGFKPQNIEFL